MTIALTLERIGLIVRAALLIAAILLGGAVALSRVYLRVHYLTDAIGGTALGFLSAAVVSGIDYYRRFNHVLTQGAQKPETVAERESVVVNR